jgi:flagellar biosynthesis component FlhA
MPARVAGIVTEQICLGLQRVVQQGLQPVVIASPQVRAVVKQLLDGSVIQNAAVLGYNEVIPGIEVQSLALVMPPEAIVNADRSVGMVGQPALAA